MNILLSITLYINNSFSYIFKVLFYRDITRYNMHDMFQVIQKAGKGID